MKKLMIIAAVVAATFVSQAASFSWKNTGGATTGTIYDYAGTKLASGITAVLIDAAVTSQTALLEAARKDGFDISTVGIAAATTTVNTSSKIGETSAFEYGEAGKFYNFYFAILDAANEQLLISEAVNGVAALEVGTQPIAFSGSKDWSKNALGDAGYTGTAGWYSTVPEPTSGLLLLLGMAGLALRRKQA